MPSKTGAVDPWQGDVAHGVAAWTRAAVPAQPEETAPPDSKAQGPDADPESVARTILLDLLATKARSRKELADKLASRNVPEDVATRVLDRFEEVSLIDDRAFARSWVESRQAGKGLARRALAQELRRKGIDDEIAREALDELEPDDEEESARLLVRKKLRSLRGVDQTTATRRLAGMLARKGYSSGVAFAVVREELAAAGLEAAEPTNPEFDI
ncbi:regulatory protein RecX [Nocardioides speluncae]|uniref:regulatory protein RecX n=1 Tax=Nocardioides speluncae TaxID=2670337 RepID=UPI000D692668|nr:regulatory protein RecX [Nocardioides speluncae]